MLQFRDCFTSSVEQINIIDVNDVECRDVDDDVQFIINFNLSTLM